MFFKHRRLQRRHNNAIANFSETEQMVMQIAPDWPVKHVRPYTAGLVFARTYLSYVNLVRQDMKEGRLNSSVVLDRVACIQCCNSMLDIASSYIDGMNDDSIRINLDFALEGIKAFKAGHDHNESDLLGLQVFMCSETYEAWKDLFVKQIEGDTKKAQAKCWINMYECLERQGPTDSIE